MQQEREVQTIYFKDLLFRALYHWKTALVVALIFAVVLGGVGLLKTRDSVNLNTATLTPEMEQKIDLLTMRIEIYQRDLERQNEYMDNSILMQINPYALYTAGFHVAIYPQSMMAPSAEASAVDTVPAIVRAYQSAMSDTETMDEIAKQLNMQSEYLAELVYIDTTVEGAVGFSFRGRSLEEAKKIADTAQEVFATKIQQVNEQVEPHTIKIIPFERGPRKDISLQDSQSGALQRLVNLTNNLNAMNAELERMLPTELTANRFDVVVYAIIGGILGVALTACCAWVTHIAGAKVYSANALSGSTGIGVLGCIPGEKKYDPITRWLRKLEGRSAPEGYDAVVCDIRARCKDVKNLLIAGNYAQSLLAGMTEELNRAGIVCTLRGGMEDPAVFEELSKCDAVLLAETCMQSRYDSVEKMAKTVTDYNKTLVGCLLIDG